MLASDRSVGFACLHSAAAESEFVGREAMRQDNPGRWVPGHRVRRMAPVVWLIVCAVLVGGCEIPLGFSGDALDAPNIVVIVADDLRYDAIGAHGNPVIATPHLDRLIQDGTTFRRIIAPTPICTPSRAEMLTGQSALATGVSFFGNDIPSKLPLLPEVLHDAGYETIHVGKWHNNEDGPLRHGFDQALAMAYGYGPHFREWNGRTYYDTELFATATVDYLRRRRSPRPFFVHLNLTVPHDPRELPPAYEGRYAPASIPVPPNFAGRHPFDHGAIHERDEGLLARPLQAAAVQAELAVYYAMVSHMDAQIGRVLATLEARGLDDETVVVFTSDHGLALGSHGLLGKQNMYDHSIGAPLIIRTPEHPGGQVSAAQGYLRDLYPTLLELAGVEIPASVEARSLVPALENPAAPGRPQLFGHYRDVQRMVRTDRWKLIHYPKLDRYQLFDLQRDPHEMQDLAGQPAHATVEADLRTRLAALQRAYGDPLVADDG